MKTITKKIDLYSYDELSKEAKEKALSDWINYNDLPFLEEAMNEKLTELLKENKLKPIGGENSGEKVMYSLSYSQGDGAMFEGEFEWKKYTVYIKQSGHYYHSNSKTIEIQETDNLGLHIDDEYEDDKKGIYAQFEEIYQKICNELEKFGYKYIEEDNSEESFKETCKANEYTFLVDGKMYNE